jgi:DNA uptake protein ComE-like DNA-binding protein
MDDSWKDLLSFNKRERNGIFVLATLIVLVICLQIAVPYIFPAGEVVNDMSTYDAYLAQLRIDSANWENEQKKKYQKKPKFKNSSQKNSYEKDDVNRSIAPEKKTTWNPHLFNPNEANEKDWKSIGLNDGQIKSIRKFVDKGGEFKSKLDVKKMYVINDSQYDKIKEYILLPDTFVSKNRSQKKYKPQFAPGQKDTSKVYSTHKLKNDTIVNLNRADTSELKTIIGIGSYYARQIVYYRNKLGGYYSLSQLFEIEHMRAETVLKISPFLMIDSSAISKIHINSDIAPLMVKHPYITWNMAINIQDHRDFSRKFKSIHDLIDNGLLNEEIYSKLAPYLEL